MVSHAVAVLPSFYFGAAVDVIVCSCGQRSLRPRGTVKKCESFDCGFCESANSGLKMAPAHRVEPTNILNNGQG